MLDHPFLSAPPVFVMYYVASLTKQQSVLKSKAHACAKVEPNTLAHTVLQHKKTFNQHLASTTIDAIGRLTMQDTTHDHTHLAVGHCKVYHCVSVHSAFNDVSASGNGIQDELQGKICKQQD